MILHRFMSEEEYECLIAGRRLMNATDHAAENGRKTTSVGFCFFAEPPDAAIHWLNGIVFPEMCVTMEVPDILVRESVATYRDCEKDDLATGLSSIPTIQRKEYCCTTYSLSDGVRVLAATDRYRCYADLLRIIESMGL